MHVVEQWLEQAFDCYLVNLSFQRPVMEGLLEDWKFHLVDTPPTEDMRIKGTIDLLGIIIILIHSSICLNASPQCEAERNRRRHDRIRV